MTIATKEPTELRVGDTWQWRRENLSDYPASAWTLTYYFRNAASHFDVVADADGDVYAVTVAKSATSTHAAGTFDWIAVVESETLRFEIGRGQVNVLPNFAAAAAQDGRSFAAKLLEYVEAELLARGSSNQLDLITATLNDRQMTRDRAGLIALRSQLISEVKRDEAANNPGRRRLLVRFER